MSFQTWVTYFLLWNTQDDILKRVSVFIFFHILYSGSRCPPKWFVYQHSYKILSFMFCLQVWNQQWGWVNDDRIFIFGWAFSLIENVHLLFVRVRACARVCVFVWRLVQTVEADTVCADCWWVFTERVGTATTRACQSEREKCLLSVAVCHSCVGACMATRPPWVSLSSWVTQCGRVKSVKCHGLSTTLLLPWPSTGYTSTVICYLIVGCRCC